MVKLLRMRNGKEKSINDDIAKYWLHFHTGPINKRDEFKKLGLKETWGEPDNFAQYVSGELGKYLNNNNYDPLAVCCAVRRKIEESVYNLLSSSDHQESFLQVHMTRDKLEEAEKYGASVPEYLYLLGIIYNDGLHWRDNQDNIAPIVSKLENLTIRHLIKKVCDG
ncbi:hypothetical protein MCHI_001397 [Candidatus Magnetoovum chiemensis]|nr:hypothetical protein MCHI_001397 [Candidatus Magnetoovum chiemensis]